MAAVTAGLTVAGLAMSAYQANKAKQDAKGAQGKQEAAIAEQQAFDRQRYEDEKQMYGPLREKLAREAMSTMPADAGRAMNEVSRNYGNVRRQIAATPAPMGLGYGQRVGANLMEAESKSRAYGDALARQRGTAMAIAAQDRSGQYAQNVSQGMGQQANYYGQQALAGQQAYNQNMQGVIQGAGQLGGMLGSYNWQGAPPVSTATNISNPNQPQQPIQPSANTGQDVSLYPAAMPSTVYPNSRYQLNPR